MILSNSPSLFGLGLSSRSVICYSGFLLRRISSYTPIRSYNNHHHHHHHHHHHQDFNFRTVLARICPLRMATISSFVQCTVTTSQLKGFSDLYDCDDILGDGDDFDDILMVLMIDISCVVMTMKTMMMSDSIEP